MLYGLGINLYFFAIRIASLFNGKAKHLLHGQKGIFPKLEHSELKDKKLVWFHVSSHGEFEQGRPLIEAFRKEHPEYFVLLTFFSPSGYNLFKEYEQADLVCYLPYDFKRNVRRFLDLTQPDLIFFIKYEFWLNYLNEIDRRKIPVYLVSAIFRKDQTFFKWYGKWYKRALYSFKHIFVQNNESKNLLHQIQLKNVTVSGDTRMDRVISIAKKAKVFPLIEQFTHKNKILVAGSTWEKEDEILIDYINKNLSPGIKVIIAPHEIRENKIQKLEKSIQNTTLRYSQAGPENISEPEVLIIDSIGILSSVYRYGRLAFIGGGFTDGIHNILEPSVFGLPVIFGPNYKKFQEAHDLLQRQSAFVIKNKNEFTSIANKIMNDDEYQDKLSTKSSDYIYRSSGATRKVLEFLKSN